MRTEVVSSQRANDFILDISEFEVDEFGRFEISDVDWLEEIGGGSINGACGNTGCGNVGCGVAG